MSVKQKNDQTTGFPHKNKYPVVIPVSLSFVRELAHQGCPGSKGRKMVVRSGRVTSVRLTFALVCPRN